MEIKKYKADFDHSYALGAFPTYELLNSRPEDVLLVLVHSSFTDKEKLAGICEKTGIKIKEDDKLISRLSDKENIYVIGIYKKYKTRLAKDRPHLMLVNPSNMGNAGTIIRTAAAFDITDIAIISPAIDVDNPKVVRGSMGSVFRVNIEYFNDFESYKTRYGAGRAFFSFMLSDEAKLLCPDAIPSDELYTLIFGNEATGLPDEYARLANPFMIPQSELVDSLNLTIAAGIGMYLFKNRK